MTDTIGTCNSRGGDSKIVHILETIDKYKFDVFYLQEIHNISAQNITKIEKGGKWKCFISPGTQRGRGVMTIINTKSITNCQLFAHDQNGNLLIIEGEIHNIKRLFMNIYAPNEMAARKKLLDKCNDFLRMNRDTYFGGDFNCIEDIHLDSVNKSMNSFMQRKSDREKLRELRETIGFIDVYRSMHPYQKVFTFTSPTNYRARLDRFYLHQTIASLIVRVEIHPVSFSDHDLVLLIQESADDRVRWGPGTYKYNKKFSENKDNLHEIKRVWLSWRKCRHKYDSILSWWDAGKRMLIRNNLIPMGKQMKRRQNQEKRDAERALKEEHSKRISNAAKIIELKQKLKDIQEREMMGAAIRAKVEWNESGEKPTKFFFSLEKQRGDEKQLRELRNDHGDIIGTKDQIINHIQNYYQIKFTKEHIDEVAMETLINSCERRLADDENGPINELFTMEELNNVKNSMKNGKSPGTDGLSVDFYKQTWSFIAQDLLDVLNYMFLSGEISLSMTQGMVTLLYKNKGDRLCLGNWRPISLLCVDYKFLTSMIARRLEPILPKLIHLDQGCAIKGRYIEDQLICIQDIVDYASQFHRKSMILALDLEAAFDRVDHYYIGKLLKHLNIGSRLENLLFTIFSNMYIEIGARTRFFKQSRSIRQGDPVAMALFVMSIEPLANLIRRDTNLRPVKIPNQQPRSVIQYCDDTTILSESVDDFNRIKMSTEIFERGAGAQLNHQKTEILLLGKWTQKELVELPQANIKDNIKILGVWFGKNAAELNQQTIINKIDKVIDTWKDIPLSFDGKILIINSKMMSQLYHVIRVTGLNTSLKNEVRKRITKFFWAPKKMHLIAYETLQNSIEKGGLWLPNLDNINDAILAERIPKYSTVIGRGKATSFTASVLALDL